MAIGDADSIPYALLVLCAEDMYSAAPGSLAPPPDPRIAAAGWSIVGYLTAVDSVFPDSSAADRHIQIMLGARVFYGFVARSQSDPSAYVAALRGTDGIVEWIIDAEFAMIAHPRYPQARVELGFFDIFEQLSLADPATGATTNADASAGVASLVGAGTLVVAGHSLGSAVATYFAEALSVQLGPRVSACLFASPRTGDAAWAALFDGHVTDYRLFNYVLDVVPHLPTLAMGYAPLPRATALQPDDVSAGIRLDLACNHHLLCYCAMINYPAEQALPLAPGDAAARACILGPSASVPETAKALAFLVNEANGVAETVLPLLRAYRHAPQA